MPWALLLNGLTAVLVFLAHRMAFKKVGGGGPDITDIPAGGRVAACAAGTGIGVFAGFLGDGPGCYV